MKNKESSTKRPYHSKRRQMQANQTRMLIVEAARKLFSERGYTGATIEAIAQEAGVAVETVYAAFGNKREILSKLIDVSIVGDDKPIPLMQRSGPQSVKIEKDQYRQIALFSHDIREIMERVAPIFEVMRVAAKTEPDIADLLQNILKNRLHGMTGFITYLNTSGSLREGLSPSEAAETTWAITSPEIFNLWTKDHGWSADQYEHWLEKTLTRLLL
jgi:AcrR family transcriptional regulator